MWEKVIAANKAVQESGVFKAAKGLLYEDGLRTGARSSALTGMEKNAEGQYIDSLKEFGSGTSGYKDLKKTREQFSRTADDNLASAKGVSAEAYKGMSDADQKRLSRQAGIKATLNTTVPVTNSDLAMKQYQKALKASKRELNARTGIGMADSYFVKPFQDGRYMAGAVRAGAAIGSVGAVGSITYSLTGGSSDYSANYSSSSGDGTTQDF